jgi:UDP-N-acetylmuramoylalanine--D-glutamate ligase
MRWIGKRVLIIGAGRQGSALAQYLAQAGAEVILNDQAPLEELAEVRQRLAGLSIRWVCGSHPIELLDGVDLLCPSGGVPLSLPLIQEANRRGIPLSNDSQIFLEECPCRVVGITGSAGKSTTTALVGHILSGVYFDPVGQGDGNKTHPPAVWVGGNIGNPMILDLPEMNAEDLAVMELSSFQLELMDRSPQVAAVLNITPNHLDRHDSMESYVAAKAHILQFQSSDDTAVLGWEDPGAWKLRRLVRGDLATFGFDKPNGSAPCVFVRGREIVMREGGVETPLMDVSRISLPGGHNLLNVLAAVAISRVLKVSVEEIAAGVETFSGIPHRLEFVREWGGAVWYNDSIATAPERTIAALRSFEAPIILLAGGRDKKLPWDALAAEVNRRVDHLILFGEAASLIRQAIESNVPPDRPFSISICGGLEDAVAEAARLAEPGDIILLAPGGTSFDEFRDFEERGEKFRLWVNELS